MFVSAVGGCVVVGVCAVVFVSQLFIKCNFKDDFSPLKWLCMVKNLLFDICFDFLGESSSLI